MSFTNHLFSQTVLTFLSAAIGKRPRNYLSCSCSPFGSFPPKNKFKWKFFLLSMESYQGPLGPQPSTLSTELRLHWYITLKNYLFYLRISKTTLQTLDQYWSTLVLFLNIDMDHQKSLFVVLSRRIKPWWIHIRWRKFWKKIINQIFQNCIPKKIICQFLCQIKLAVRQKRNDWCGN